MGNDELAKILIEHSYLNRDPGSEEPFSLASGRTSWHYFDCQATTMRAEAMPLIGRAFLERIRAEGSNPEAAGGLTRGADPIAQAVAYASLTDPPIVNAFSVRKAQKDHGTSRWIEGPANPGARVVVVDDVITTGGSVIEAIERCKEADLEIVQVVILVDRDDGGLAKIQQAVPNVSVSSIFNKEGLDWLRDVETGRTTASD